MQGRRWQTGSWLLSLARPSESNQREGRPWFPAPARPLRYSTSQASADLARRYEKTHRRQGASSDKSSPKAPDSPALLGGSQGVPKVTQCRNLSLSTVVS